MEYGIYTCGVSPAELLVIGRYVVMHVTVAMVSKYMYCTKALKERCQTHIYINRCGIYIVQRCGTCTSVGSQISKTYIISK